MENSKYKWDDKTILIAEDIETSNRYYKAALRGTNAKVIFVDNGKDAVETCKKNPKIDIVLMDIHMPEMNGFEATKEIIKIRKDLPVIMQTAYILSGEEKKSYEAGCVGFLVKPIKYDLFLSSISKYLDK